jgi:deoxyuridine 5'-triphosphate nucleotidohydrolase
MRHGDEELTISYLQESKQVFAMKMTPTARTPMKSTELAAGFDLYADEEAIVPSKGRKPISTGIALRLPDGTYGRITPRSGLAVKQSIDIAAGVIDQDYTGIIKAVLVNQSDTDLMVKPGERIAQLIIEKISLVPIVEVQTLPETQRGTASFGSTGIYRVSLEEVEDEEAPKLSKPKECKWLDKLNKKSLTQIQKGVWEINEEEHYIKLQQHLDHQLYWSLRDEGKIVNIEDYYIQTSTKDAGTDGEWEEAMWQHIPKEYWDYKDVFSKETFDNLPKRSKFDHAVNLDKTFVPKHARPFLLSPREQKELDEFLKENLETGRINPSKSPQTVPFFFAEKPDKSALRPIQDYRPLNAHTIRDRYSLPVLEELPQRIGKAKYFTVIDIRWGFNNIRIKEGDEWKAVFTTNRGSYKPSVMFFGLCNSPPSFQRMMDVRFHKALETGKVFIYMDDIIIFTEDMEEHR